MITATKPIPLHVTLNNRWAIFQCNPELQQKLKKYFRFRPKGYEYAPSYKDGSWNGFKNLFLRGRVSSGLFLQRKSVLEKKYELKIQDLRVTPEFRKHSSVENSDKENREYQNQCLTAMKACSTGGIILIATGGGKTLISGSYFKDLVGNGLFLVDELTLLDQTRLEFAEVIGEEIGIVGKSQFKPKRITVATIQTLQRYRKKLAFRKWFSTIVAVFIDEIHVAINKRNIDVIQSIRPLAVFGLTATLQLEHTEVLYRVTSLTGPVIFEYKIQQGTKEGYLTKGVVCCVQFYDPLRKPTSGYWTLIKNKKSWVPPWSRSSEYRFHICLNKSRNDVVESLVREGLKRKKRIIVLVERRNHLKVLTSRFQDIEHRVLSGDHELSGDSKLRIKALKDMDAGTVPLILASKVMGKGANVKTVDVIIDATALPGHNNAIQRYGRGVRTAEGKEELLYIDIADVRNKFAHTAILRAKALKETGARIVKVDWEGDSKEIYERVRVLLGSNK